MWRSDEDVLWEEKEKTKFYFQNFVVKSQMFMLPKLNMLLFWYKTSRSLLFLPVVLGFLASPVLFSVLSFLFAEWKEHI